MELDLKKNIIPNIILSTTRMWNCGDDFIAFGVKKLLEESIGTFNPVAYNRAPSLHQLRIQNVTVAIDLEGQEIERTLYINPVMEKVWKLDNSWTIGRSLSHIDYVIFAGTPECFGEMNQPLVEELLKTNVPVAYLGIGGFEGSDKLRFEELSSLDQQLLRRAKLVTVRDSRTKDLLGPITAETLPCPALYSSAKETLRTNKQRIALCAQASKSLQPLDDKTVYQYTIELIKTLSEYYDCTLVCHYIDEIDEFNKFGLPILYSYDPVDYFQIYDQFDLTVTTRVHGAGICASLGIPAIVVQHSARNETVNGFLSEVINPAKVSIAEALEKISDLDIETHSKAIIEHKKESKKIYLDKIDTFMAHAVRQQDQL